MQRWILPPCVYVLAMCLAALALLLASCAGERGEVDPSGARCVRMGEGLRAHVAVCPNTADGAPQLAVCDEGASQLASCLDDHAGPGRGAWLICPGDAPVRCVSMPAPPWRPQR